MHPSVLNLDQVREVDRRAVDEYGIPSIVLMENAGRGVVDTLCRLGIDGPVVVGCGRGNNGGDGLVVARHLDLRRFDVTVLLACHPDTLAGDAATNYRILARTDVPIQIMSGDTWYWQCWYRDDPAPSGNNFTDSVCVQF